MVEAFSRMAGVTQEEQRDAGEVGQQQDAVGGRQAQTDAARLQTQRLETGGGWRLEAAGDWRLEAGGSWKQPEVEAGRQVDI